MMEQGKNQGAVLEVLENAQMVIRRVPAKVRPGLHPVSFIELNTHRKLLDFHHDKSLSVWTPL